jgi:peptide-methionine (S)-S-oxide reductase
MTSITSFARSRPRGLRRAACGLLALLGLGSAPLTAQTKPALQTAVFAGGCFWGVEAVFEHLKGVKQVVSGYSGGAVVNPDYNSVSSGRTGHAEAVRVVFDPAVVSYETLLKVFFSVAHDPTELNRQGPDVGTQYRSAIYTTSPEQAAQAQAVIAQLTAAKTYRKPIVTEVKPLAKFYDAEAYHQNYLYSHTDQPYIVYNDLPKLDALKKQYPSLWEDTKGK